MACWTKIWGFISTLFCRAGTSTTCLATFSRRSPVSPTRDSTKVPCMPNLSIASFASSESRMNFARDSWSVATLPSSYFMHSCSLPNLLVMSAIRVVWVSWMALLAHLCC